MRIIYLKITYSESIRTVSHSMSLREHILYFFTASYIPFGNIMLSHKSLLFFCKSLTLSYTLHNCKCIFIRHIMEYEINHNIISCRYNLIKSTCTICNKLLCISVPHICTMRKSRNFNKTRK